MFVFTLLLIFVVVFFCGVLLFAADNGECFCLVSSLLVLVAWFVWCVLVFWFGAVFRFGFIMRIFGLGWLCLVFVVDSCLFICEFVCVVFFAVVVLCYLFVFSLFWFNLLFICVFSCCCGCSVCLFVAFVCLLVVVD